MHRSRLAQIIIDCQVSDLQDAAAFWGEALGRPVRKLADAVDANYRELVAIDGDINILVQRVAHPSRVHLDIETDDVEAEVRRLEGLGAVRVEQVRTWWVMEAPTGQRFCVLQPQTDILSKHGNLWT